jgi:hypothetical protein
VKLQVLCRFFSRLVRTTARPAKRQDIGKLEEKVPVCLSLENCTKINADVSYFASWVKLWMPRDLYIRSVAEEQFRV